ncbi:MAG: pyruvate kinase [Armatimonadetes bacterium]|nr:pyruvate kinase [Armatimonadota bacterium]
MPKRRTKIVATIGPATDSPGKLKALVEAGMDVARLNFSHGTHEDHDRRVRSLRAIADSVGRPLALLQDLQGPKIRVGEIRNGPVHLKRGQEFTLTSKAVPGTAQAASVEVPALFEALWPGAVIYLDDGLLEMKALKVGPEEAVCRVVTGGPLSSRKGLNLPGVTLPIPALTEKDRADLEFGIEKGVDWVALSFVRSAEDIRQAKRMIEERQADIPVLAKIEKHEAVRNLDAILDAADGAMVARGDLGIEVPMQEVPLLQKRIIARCNEMGKPVITATQMLDSMIRNPRPTRAELADIANAILDGTDAVMLSGETAIGAYPLEAVRTMGRVACAIERSLNYTEMLRCKTAQRVSSVTDAIGQAACDLAQDLQADAVVAPTTSGQTACVISKYRPEAQIIAPATRPEVLRRLALVWGVHPVAMEPSHTTDDRLTKAVEAAVRSGLLRKGDLTVITTGVPAGQPGNTNLIKVHHVGDILTQQ